MSTVTPSQGFPHADQPYDPTKLFGGSARVTDDAAKAVQKTPNRVSLDSILMKITNEEYLHPQLHPHMTIAVITLENGFVVVGKSAPADEKNFDEKLGMQFAKDDAIRQVWQLEGYLLRQKLHERE